MCLENAGRDAAAAEEHSSKSLSGITCFEDFSFADSTWKGKAFLEPELCLLSWPHSSVMIIGELGLIMPHGQSLDPS